VYTQGSGGLFFLAPIEWLCIGNFVVEKA